MANEFIHIDPGEILTKAEFELITGHQFNSQATGDILYASDSTQLSRLGIGSNTNVLEITGGVPAWVATSGTGSVARVTSPTFVTPALGTPSALVGTNISGTASSLTAGNVTTNANLTGHITSSGNAAVLGSFTSAQLAAALSNETGSGAAVFGTSPTLVTPALGTPASGVATNITGLPIAGLANGTDGELITWNASGVAAAVAVGSTDQVLTSNGSGAAPTFQAAAGGSGTDISARAFDASSQSIANNSVTIIELDSETFDTDTIHDNSTNNSRLTAKTAGVYVIIGQVIFATNGTGRRLLRIQYNGSTVIAGQEWDVNQNDETSMVVSTIYKLDANDYVEMYAFQSSGGALSTTRTAEQGSELSMAKILG